MTWSKTIVVFYPVWPDDMMKSSPKLSKNCPNTSCRSFYQDVMLDKIAHIVAKCLGNFLVTFVVKKFKK